MHQISVMVTGKVDAIIHVNTMCVQNKLSPGEQTQAHLVEEVVDSTTVCS
jgi:hypothetical protein